MKLLHQPISASDRIPDRFCTISMEFLSLSRRCSSSRNVLQRRWTRRNVCHSQAIHVQSWYDIVIWNRTLSWKVRLFATNHDQSGNLQTNHVCSQYHKNFKWTRRKRVNNLVKLLSWWGKKIQQPRGHATSLKRAKVLRSDTCPPWQGHREEITQYKILNWDLILLTSLDDSVCLLWGTRCNVC